MLSLPLLPVSVEDECIIIIKFLGMKFVLLSSLVCHIMTVTTREDDLISIMDIASYLKLKYNI